MHLKQDDMIHYYLVGHWDQLAVFLEAKIKCCLDEGNEVQLARALSYYGLVHLYLANNHLLSTLYKQIHDEYRREPSDIRVKACYARFLAAYYAFAGDTTQAADLYHISLRCYEQTDWYADEAIAIMESIYWLGLFSHERNILLKSIERLKTLDEILDGWLQEELIVLKHCMKQLQKLDKSSDLQEDMETAPLLNTVSFSCSPQPAKALFTHSRLFLFAVQCLCSTVTVLTGRQQANQAAGYQQANWRNFAQKQSFPKYVATEMIQGLLAVIQLCAEQKWDSVRALIEANAAKLEQYRHPWFSTMMLSLSNLALEQRLEIPPPSFRLSITLFKSFRLQWQQAHLSAENWGTKQERELFLFVLTQPHCKVTKEIVMEEFFPGDDYKKSANRLYVAIHRINRAFQKSFQLPPDMQVIQIHHGAVTIPDHLIEEVDVHTYQKLLSVANQLWSHNRKGAVELMNKARQLYSVDMLPNLIYLDWLNQYRETLKNLQIRTLTRLAQYYYGKGELHEYEEATWELLNLDPAEEERYKPFIQYLLSCGRNAEAYQWYQTLERELEREIGITPSADWKQMIAPLFVRKGKYGGEI